MDALNNGILAFNDAFWAYLLIPLLTILAIYFTIRSKAVQIRLIPEMFRALASDPGMSEDGKKPISSFQAFAVSAAARIGTGNIAGVATAIALGGPGAVFWMWVMGLLVGSASFVESTLAQLYKVRGGTSGFRGGPAYYMKFGLKAPWMGVLFAITITLTFAFVFTAVQSNTISGALAQSVETVSGSAPAPWFAYAVGIVLAAVTALIILGGAKRIAQVATALVPLMAGIYILLGLVIIVMNIGEIPGVIASIVTHAFGIQEIAAGGVGTAIIQGVRRGMFSNEAGLGSAPNAGASAAVTHPVKQGLVQTLGVYLDTLIVCSTTAFIVLLSNPVFDETRGATMTQDAVAANLGSWTIHLMSLIILLVAYTSVLGNTFYGESNVGYLTQSPTVMLVFRWLVVVVVFLGAIGSVDLIWNLADATMGIMALINLAAIAPLAGVAIRLLSDYTAQRKEGKDPVFTKDRMPDLVNVQCWDASDLPSAGPASATGSAARD
ncbi:alanine/glycine:cation symporter family protein [Streptomonospora nanhaiensis]|uniref:AGCS family alanine or glycine:cation symporter n=1 Tax=Streptomonospora nanhaiensis TaxID=1323731 RepID=A0A853BPA0_9ACTN|nr:alanine/glycine:cation symporter family protein [Streptomonospora nanhaiensis]MBV2365749.1 alanine:cation symporter family protein [Streptomonospora nanhaiensis]MBX9388896.1 alanine:cation symporter family protein [Streptomonospora nanhaiensis]NYI96545.1 AGCS family alanine or glycine:cation symporter [Streptomonospora nanhaiensis]